MPCMVLTKVTAAKYLREILKPLQFKWKIVCLVIFHLSLCMHASVSFSGWLEHRFSDIFVFSLVKFLAGGSPKLLPGSQLREGTGVFPLQSIKVYAASIPTWNVHEDAPPPFQESAVSVNNRITRSVGV